MNISFGWDFLDYDFGIGGGQRDGVWYFAVYVGPFVLIIAQAEQKC